MNERLVYAKIFAVAVRPYLTPAGKYMGFWIKDLQQAARRLVKSRSFFLTVVLMLALGIGATTTISSLIEGILLRPLPFRDPSRVVQLGEHVGENPGIGITARDIRA